MPITVRPAGPADRDAVGGMIGAFMDYLEAIEPHEGEAPSLDYLLDQSFGPAPVCATLIAEQDGTPVGYVGYHLGVWEIYRVVYVISLFVRAEARGSGAGRALVGATKAIARAHQAKRLVWEVWRKNPVAIDFYRSIGGEVHDDNLRMSLVVE